MTPADIIAALNMQPHPEGGHYLETCRADPGPDGRATSTAIYFLLQRGERSAWHRIDADEYWLWHAGAPLRLFRHAHEATTQCTLGPDILHGQFPQALIEAGEWQAAESLGDWTLVSCVVAPGFEFSGFEMAPDDVRPT
jgi:predicted cupin superfamily sugar epimerase